MVTHIEVEVHAMNMRDRPMMILPQEDGTDAIGFEKEIMDGSSWIIQNHQRPLIQITFGDFMGQKSAYRQTASYARRFEGHRKR